MKRILFFGLTPRSPCANSTSAAEPEPLSLMPGPGPTLSRCAPTTTTLFGSPPRVSAITFSVGVAPVRSSTRKRAVLPTSPCATPPASDCTVATCAATIGMSIPAPVISNQRGSTRPGTSALRAREPVAAGRQRRDVERRLVELDPLHGHRLAQLRRRVVAAAGGERGPHAAEERGG